MTASETNPGMNPGALVSPAPVDRPGSRRPRLIYLVTEDWYFWSHRLPMARAARDAGFDVSVATRVDRHGNRIAAEGFRLLPLRWRRSGRNPLGELLSLIEIARLYAAERPDIVHHVAIKPTVYGSIAAWIAGVPSVVNALAGLGFLFTSRSRTARWLRGPMRAVLKVLLHRPNAMLLLQNEDDLRTLGNAGLVRSDRIAVIRGSGIDLDAFGPMPERDVDPVVMAVVTRMLEFKGVACVVAAHRELRRRGLEAELLLAGSPDEENPAAIPASTLDAWSQEPGIAWLGHVADIRTVWERADIAVFTPDGGEGLPRTLLEAAACGRPIVASDVAGCREVARPGINALLVPPRDAHALADALERLVRDRDLRRKLAAGSRHVVESDLSATAVGATTVALYRRLVAEEAAGAAARTPS